MNTVKFTVPAGHRPGNVANSDANNRYSATSNAVLFRSAVPAASVDGVARVNPECYLTATNGRILCLLPVEAENVEHPLLVPASACNANGKSAVVEVNGEVRTTIGKKTSVQPVAEQEGIFPCIKQVFPDATCLNTYKTVRLDANLLLDLAKSISEDGIVTLLIPEVGAKSGTVEKPIVAVANGIGLIMPMSGGTRDNPDSVVKTAKDDFARHVAAVPQAMFRFPVAKPE